MSWQTLWKRASALTLAAVLTVTLALPASAAEAISDGVAPTYDEAYYATLDYYGNLLEGSVVKSYSLNGKDSLTDYGVYDEVVNLTDSTVPATESGTTTFRFGSDAPDHFYFEGKTKQPFDSLPWSITLRYTLNGVPAKAEDLAGKQGVVEILLDILPNEQASDYARYNYTLAATALFNQDDILSLEAEGAQVQLVGNLRTVLYLCLPGEEQHFTIRVGSNDFSFGGLTVLMVPATLAQLEEIAKLSERKDDLEEDYRALSGSLDDLLDALADIQSGLYASAAGLDQLNKARGTFSSGKGALYSGTDKLREDLSNIGDLMEPIEERIQVLSATVTNSKALLNELTDATVDLQGYLAEMEIALYGLEQGTVDLAHVIDVAADMEGSLLRLEHALGGSHINTHSVSANSKALVDKVKSAHGAYAAKNQQEFMVKLLMAQGLGEAAAKAKAASQAEQIEKLQQAMQNPDFKPTQEQQEALKQAQDLQNLYAAAQSGQIKFQDFCEQLPGVSEDTAKQMNNLWLIYSSVGSVGKASASSVGGGRNNAVSSEIIGGASGAQSQPEDTGAAPEPDVTETPELAPNIPDTTPDTPAESTPGTTLDPTPEPAPGPAPELTPEPSDSGEPAEPEAEAAVPESDSEAPVETLGKGQMAARLVAYDPGEDGDSPDEPSAPANPATPTDPVAPTDPTPTPGSSGDEQTVGGAVVDIIASGLDYASSQINQIQYELTSAINEIKAPTSRVVGDLADLCGEVGLLTASLNDAEDLMYALRMSSGDLRDILADVDALRLVLNDYEPTLQEALANAGTLSTTAVATIRDTESLLTDAEDLARSTGVNLDAGTKQSLSGLSAALRQTAKALALTADVKDAKKTITDIIEDTWNEYTGDVNNILMMDATADPVSLTDGRNPTPTSIQVLIRTQEIKTEDEAESEEAAAAKEKTTFLGRVAQMFKDFWNAVTGIFH